MSVSPGTVTVSAVAGQPAPTATFQVDVSGATASQQFYLSGQFSSAGISDVLDAAGSFPITITIQFKDPATLGAGTYTDSVQIDVCEDQACTKPVGNSPATVQVTYNVQASSVTLTALSPSSTVASGPAFTLTLTGTHFTPQSLVQWNGSARPTSYTSSTQLTAQITAADIATAGTVPVVVSDSGYGTSNALNFTIQPAVLGISAISPAKVSAGNAAFTLTVLGSAYTATSVVQWNGTARPTTYVSDHELLAQIGAADVASIGSAQITVHDPASAVGTTAAQTLSVVAVSKDAVSFQMNTAHTGAVSFDNLVFPTGPSWSVDVGGTPSYALIAQGLVIVTVSVTGGSSQLVALDQADGHTVWGPVVIAGTSNAAYDSGKVFALSSIFGNAGTMEAFDASTGAQLWSTLLTGQYAFDAAPTAANGFVYNGAAGIGGTLYAVDQATGNLAWTQEVENGDDSAPAVTADGVYVTYPCWTYDFRPATGESIWNSNTGCEGGGGATPVVANGLVYSPNANDYSGDVYNAETGVSAGTYVADAPPAFTATQGFYLQGGTLRAVSLGSNSVQWSFAGDGQLAGSPIVVNGYVLIGSGSGNLYALDVNTGQQAWLVNLGAAIVARVGNMPLSSLAAGDGLVVVPAGTKVTAYTLSAQP
ncbi:MAG TPA: PQQ-binding-like beta-propeller repeat protein [Steroidobacteraceae bacterium]|nr:PQQ-binding-like beta-propeller repeat protein [Steroidobacteraceae bacterium]